MEPKTETAIGFPKFGGSSTDNLTDFETIFRGIFDVSNIGNNRRVGFLKQLK